MSARRRRAGGGAKAQGNGQQPTTGSGRRRKAKEQVGFWGDAAKLPPPVQDVTVTSEPAAVVHSLGVPPLPGHEVIATHYFTAIYDKAVTVSGALAAAAGLIEPDELVEALGD